MSALEVTGVSHSFGKIAALSEVSLSVGEGRFLALLGVNGAGKTTLFSLVTRLYDNVTGSIRVGGFDVRRDPGPALARLGVVFQSNALDRDLTIRQNLYFHASLHGMRREEIRAATQEMIARVGLKDRLDQKAGTLSGGQLRRADIARAMMHKPRLMLLDEPTVGLDVKSRSEINDLIRGLIREEGIAVVWATHLLDEIRPDDTVAVLHHGRILRTSFAADIAGEGTLERAFLSMTGAPREALV